MALDDVFQFQPGGSISGRVEGNDGRDTIDFSPLTGPVNVNEITHTATNIGGTYFGIENLIGSKSTADKLTSNEIFVLHGPNEGATNRSDSGGYITFTSVENLASTTANQFKFFGGSSISGKITAGAGSYLNYGQSFDSAGVTVDLTKGTATKIGGGISGIRDVYGTIGPDTLIGNGEDNHFWGDDGNDLLVGGDGNDTLDGGSNQDLIIGGNGDDTLTGGTGEDVIIGGAGADVIFGLDGNDLVITGKADSFDPAVSSGAVAKLLLIQKEWTRTDAGYHDRIDHLTKGTGLTGGVKLNSSTITDDKVADTVTGGLGNDWFIVGKSKDTVTDPNVPTAEVTTKI